MKLSSDELLERVKAATGPDRRIDAWLNVKLDDPKQWNWQIRENPDQIGDVSVYNHSAIPPYTASIDAALALVQRCLPGCAWSITEPHAARKRKRKPDNVRIPFDAYIANNDNVGVPGHVFALTEGPTPALAILTALLTSLQALGETP